jgi:hypothetical protein
MAVWASPDTRRQGRSEAFTEEGCVSSLPGLQTVSSVA